MSEIKLKVTTITFDKEKSKKLNFYINGKISNTDKIDNILVSSDFSDNIAMFAISENMETVIENSNTPISAMREIKTYQKKLIDEHFSEISNGFESSVKSTYDFIYGVDGDNEIEFSKNKLFTGLVLKDDQAKIITTNYNSCYYISNNVITNCFSSEEVLTESEGNNEEEGEFSPSSGIMKNKNLNELQDGDLFVIATQNINSKLSNEIMESLYNDRISGEELAWEIINEVSSKDITDEIIIMIITVVNVVKSIAKPEKASKFSGFFKNEPVDDEIDEEVIEEKEEIIEEEPTEEPTEEHATYNEFTSIKIQNPGRMKKRMNIYIKRLISIVVVILLLAGIGFGMFKLFTLIFSNNKIEVTPTPSIPPVESIVVPSPTPTATPTPTPSPTPTPVQDLYRDYIVKDGDSLWKISTMFFNSADYIDDIVSYNDNLSDANSIFVGQKLKIPFLNTTPTPSGSSD
ncbi:MAG: LysM peptidoglycan-binding domain-containing protein [Clostridiales bacterium]|nr:LysM peptidoglycan-binding domain-containing protein [Clostridiales bacterium]